VVEEILGDYQHVVEEFRLLTGSGGAFEFRVDGELLFSKKTMQRRHAEPGEIVALFREVIGPEVAVYQ
jgi:predicted Rdx family selenoprotein